MPLGKGIVKTCQNAIAQLRFLGLRLVKMFSKITMETVYSTFQYGGYSYCLMVAASVVVSVKNWMHVRVTARRRQGIWAEFDDILYNYHQIRLCDNIFSPQGKNYITVFFPTT